MSIEIKEGRVVIEKFNRTMHDIIADAHSCGKSTLEAEIITESFLGYFKEERNYEALCNSAREISRLYYPNSFRKAQAN